MLPRVLLLWLGVCSPLLLAFSSLWWFCTVSLSGVVVALLAVRLLAQQPAPAGAAEPFRNIVIAHRGGQRTQDADIDDKVFPENSLAAYRW